MTSRQISIDVNADIWIKEERDRMNFRPPLPKQIPAKPTTYNGQIYRSRLEARWAIYFDNLLNYLSNQPNAPNRSVVYESYSFEISSGNPYTPDFTITESSEPTPGRIDLNKFVHLEIKPCIPIKKYLEEFKAIALKFPDEQFFLLHGTFYKNDIQVLDVMNNLNLPLLFWQKTQFNTQTKGPLKIVQQWRFDL